MRRLLLIAVVFSLAFAAGAQELKIPQIREDWPMASIEVPQVKGKVGISEFAYAVANAFHGNILTDELKAQLDNPGRLNEDVDEFILDRKNGYCGFSFVSDGTINMQMCYWSRKDARKLVAIKMFNVYEDEKPLLMLYNYNPDSGRLEPELDIEPLDLAVEVVGLNLPRTGKDIEVFLMDMPEPAWLIYDGDGGFDLEVAYDAVGCFVEDKGLTNVRVSPGGDILCQLPDGDVYMMAVHDPVNGWWKIAGRTIYTMDGEINLKSEGWIHSSVIGAALRNYDGKPEPLYEAPSSGSKIVGEIKQQEAVVNLVDYDKDSSWVKIKFGKLTGWVDSDRLCGNALTTCP